jgi:ASCH domain-containing protein
MTIDMKCLSLKQPYAELLVSGKKSIELRNWNTSFRGKFLVHASKNIDKDTSESLGIDYSMLIRGAIIGTAVLYNIKQYRNKTELERDRHKHLADTKEFGFCKYGFMIKNAHRLSRSIPYPGMLKFFEVDYPVAEPHTI